MSSLGEYGQARLSFLRACRPEQYQRMLDEGTLDAHLQDIDDYCHSEELKAEDFALNLKKKTSTGTEATKILSGLTFSCS